MPYQDGKSFSMPTDAEEVRNIWKEKAQEYGARGVQIREEIKDGQAYLVKEAGGEEVWTPVTEISRRGGRER
jgi:hypothetical protein